MRARVAYIISLLVCSTIANAQSFAGKILPRYAQVQYAGNIGVIAGGLGYNLKKDRVLLTVLDGYTPAEIAGSAVNTVAVRVNYNLFQPSLKNLTLKGYIGTGCNFETTGNGFYSKLPERYTHGYYKTNAIHATLQIGGRLLYPLIGRERQALEVYAETGTLDSYLYYYFANKNLKITEIFSAALGLRYHFGRKAAREQTN